jgi:hypothetical protein
MFQEPFGPFAVYMISRLAVFLLAVTDLLEQFGYWILFAGYLILLLITIAAGLLARRLYGL